MMSVVRFNSHVVLEMVMNVIFRMAGKQHFMLLFIYEDVLCRLVYDCEVAEI